MTASSKTTIITNKEVERSAPQFFEIFEAKTIIILLLLIHKTKINPKMKN